MRILGVGLSKTGTSSVHAALRRLGLRSLHYDRTRLCDVVDGSNPRPDFRRYDDLDAVLDLPAAYFYQELVQAYPDCRCILTVRDEESWWQSIRLHFNERSPVASLEQDPFRFRLRNMVYGSQRAGEFLYRKRYREHNQRVLSTIPADRLLVMNVTAGDGWEKLCPFLGKDIPDEPFPRQNATPRNGHDYIHELYLANQEISRVVAPDERFILLDQDWWRAELTRGAQAMPFTQRGGVYWGPPPDQDAAIAEFESLRQAGARFAVVGWPAFWWLEFYHRLCTHLRSAYRCVLSNERLIIFDLARPAHRASSGGRR